MVRRLLVGVGVPLPTQFLQLADSYLQVLQKETGFPLIICDETGTIVRANVKKRIGNVHHGAQRIMRGEVDEVEITAEQERTDPRVKEGYNCAIIVDEQRVAALGMAAPLAHARPLVRVSALVLAAWLKQLGQEARLHAAAAKVFSEVDTLTEGVERSSRATAESTEQMAAATTNVAERLATAEKVVDTVRTVAQQSRILSINGMVQATRAGDEGRAFAVVAREMTRFADETKETSVAVQGSLAEIGRAVAAVRDAGDRTSAAVREQSAMLGQVTRTMGELKTALAGLERTFGAEGEPGVCARAERRAR